MKRWGEVGCYVVPELIEGQDIEIGAPGFMAENVVIGSGARVKRGSQGREG